MDADSYEENSYSTAMGDGKKKTPKSPREGDETTPPMSISKSVSEWGRSA